LDKRAVAHAGRCRQRERKRERERADADTEKRGDFEAKNKMIGANGFV
jgi:hypothetical protein